MGHAWSAGEALKGPQCGLSAGDGDPMKCMFGMYFATCLAIVVLPVPILPSIVTSWTWVVMLSLLLLLLLLLLHARTRR